MAESKVYEFNTLFFWDLFSVSDLTKVYLASTVTAIIETQVSARFQHLVEWRVLEVKKHMVKCYENAYRPKNLSLFALNVEGYWGQIKKKFKETFLHMAKCNENAYRPKNLSLFAFIGEGYWGQIKKKLKETKIQMFLSMSLHLWKCFAFLHGFQKIAE